MTGVGNDLDSGLARFANGYAEGSAHYEANQPPEPEYHCLPLCRGSHCVDSASARFNSWQMAGIVPAVGRLADERT